MKKVFNSLFVIIAAMVTFAGCAKQEIDAPATPETKTVQFFANSIETKTAFGTPTDGVYPTLWSEGDKVDVSVNFAQKKSSSEVECSDDFKSARFEVDLSGTEVEAPYTFYSVSPVDRLRGVSSQNKRFYVEILSEQTPLATSVDKDAQLLFAKSSTTDEMPSSVELTYHHLTAYGKFSLTNLAAESVSSIILEAEFDIAGKWDYFVEDGSFKVRSGNGSKSITLTTSSTTDIWFACAPVDMTGQKMTLTVTTEKGNFVKVLNFPADKDRKFEAGKISKFTVDMAGITAGGSEEPEQPGETTEAWTLVTDASTLAVGDKVVIAAAEYDFALSTEQRSNNRNQAPITKNSNTITITDDVQVMTLEAGTKAGTYAFNTGSGYLYAASSGSNYLKTENAKSDNSSWTISITDEGIATIKAQGTNTRNWLRYNSANTNPNPIFSCYGSGQKDVSIYRLEGANQGGGETPEPELQERNLQFSVTTTTATVGEEFAEPTLTGADAGVTYSSSNTNVATVNETTGEVTLVAAGETTITASAPATDQYEAGTASYTLTVNPSQGEEPGDAIKVTVAEFVAMTGNETGTYELSGEVTEIYQAYNSTYGNISFYINDGTGSVLIFRMACDSELGEGIKVNDRITVQGKPTVYQDKIQMAQGGTCIEYVSAPTLEVSPANITVEADVTTAVFELSCDTGYDITYPEGVVEVSEVHSNETASSTYTVSFPVNETAEPIIYVITVKADAEGFDVEKTVTITQKAASQGGGDEGEPVTEKVVFEQSGYSNGEAVSSVQIGAVNVTFDKGSNNNAPKYYNTGTAIRVYGGNTFTLASDKTITKVVFTFASGEGSNAISATPGTFSDKTWTGEANSVKFTIGGTSGHRRIASIEVTYLD